MVNYPNRPPRLGSTDWAAQRFLRMLEREEQEAAELKRLQEAGWSPPPLPTLPSRDEAVFGDGRDAVVDHVQAEIDRRKALRAEAQRRVAATPIRAAFPMRPNDEFGRSDPRLTFVAGERAVTGGGRPPRTPYEMSPGLKQVLGLGVGTGVAVAGMSSLGDEMAARRFMDQIRRDIIRQYGYYPPYPGSPASENPRSIGNVGDNNSPTSPKTFAEPDEFPPGPPPRGALGELEDLIRPKLPRDLEPVDLGDTTEMLVPPRFGPQDFRPGGNADTAQPRPEPLIREAWSPTLQELLDWLLVLNSKGSLQTQQEVDHIAKLIVKGAQARGLTAEHVHGGTSLREAYFRAKDEGRLGSGRPDGTVLIGREGEEKRRLDFNTARYLQDRKTAVAHERRALEKLRRLQALWHETAYHMAIFPKGRGFSPELWQATVDRAVNDLLTELFGPSQ